MKTICNSVLMVLSIVGATSVHAQVPLLNSLPSAGAVIFLDFDGHTVAGTVWNMNGPIYAAPSGLNSSQITTVFNRVAEDYRPFNVNITTDSTVFLAAQPTQRMRVIETVTYEWWGAAAGVAVIGSFTWGDDSPSFVFVSLLSYNPKSVAEATSHEAGHTLGLQHQSVYNSSCIKTAEYNTGAGSGEIGWAPIMGNGFTQNLTLWNSGKSSVHCDSIQNELSIITTSNGFGFRTDDHSGSFMSATVTPFINNQFTIDGIITQSTDLDMIRISQPANGRFLSSAVPYNVGLNNAGSDLDLQVTLYDASQNQLNVYNPGTLLSSIIDTQLNAGIYYLRIEGRGNMYAPDYASLGSYSISGVFMAGALPLKKLELSGEVRGGQHKLHWVIEADEAVIKQVLEISTDGVHFNSLAPSATVDRSFAYSPFNSVPSLYRLHVTFDNNHEYYSNVVMLKNILVETPPKLLGNRSTDHVQISSSGMYEYSIFEMSGRVVLNGSISKGLNTVSTAPLNRGLYIIRYTKGAAYWTEKFVRQ